MSKTSFTSFSLLLFGTAMFLAAGLLFGQTPSSEVASIKPSQPIDPATIQSGQEQRGMTIDGARVVNQELAARSKVVLFSSHELEVVERVCWHIVILHRGKLVADDSIERQRTLMALPTLEEIFSQFAVEQDTVAISRQIADLILA